MEKRTISILFGASICIFLFFLMPTHSAIENSIDNGITFLYESQLEYGEFRTYACPSEKMDECYFDSSPFGTAHILYSLGSLDDERIDEMKERGLDFLLSEQHDGVCGYWSSRNPEHRTLDPDIDDTSVISRVLQDNGVEFEGNIANILNNKNEEGLFQTFLRDWDNDVDCVVNTNVLLYLGESDPVVCGYVNSAIVSNRSCSFYYPNRLVLFYAVGRAFSNGVECFEKSKDAVIESTLAFQTEYCSFGSDMDTALALNAIMDFGYYGREVEEGIRSLIGSQSPDGSWDMDFFYATEDYSYGSKELTTAFAIEALEKYRRHMIMK